jgi:hypothetical protein
MAKNFNLKNILNVKIDGTRVWKNRVRNQSYYIHLLEDVFETEISTETFGFYPERVYFASSLTADPEYTKRMKPAWNKMIKEIEKFGWNVYAPFNQTDPHAKNPDTLDSYQIRDLDHIQVLTAEVALMDLNRPSHGVGQEIEMSVFMPKIGFSQAKVSRMTKGMPGLMVLNYEDEKELIGLLKKIFQRANYKKEPFYLAKCSEHPTQSIFKGKDCLQCAFKEHLHQI